MPGKPFGSRYQLNNTIEVYKMVAVSTLIEREMKSTEKKREQVFF